MPMSWQAVPEFSTVHFDYSTAFEMEDLPWMIIQLRGRRRIAWAAMKSNCVDSGNPKMSVNPRNKPEQKVVKGIGMSVVGQAAEYALDFGSEWNGSR